MKSLFFLLVFFGLTSCTPKIYVIDRQTVLEEEAAGRWPQFEKDLIEKAKSKGPTPFAKVPVNARRARLYNVLNGELTSQLAIEPVVEAKK